jgi:hypothetical protein
VGLGDPQTEFLIYSRGSGGAWPEAEREAWVSEIERRFPQVEGRVATFYVTGEEEVRSFRDPAIGRVLREQVVAILGLVDE